jgi:BirA family transcriptional regulator, biotin operon repressor / biotin---[acetyl-CoA-carboxylase] ligase
MKAWKILTLDTVDSTNNYLHQLLKDCIPDNLTLAVANEQTKGRGQQGSSWESEHGKNLLFSILFYPQKLSAEKQFFLSQVTSLAISDSVERIAGLKLSIKWPNDIYYKDSKLAGILIENSILGDQIQYSIIGVGLNVNQEVFYSDALNPVSLIQIAGCNFILPDLLDIVKVSFSKYLDLLDHSAYEIINREYLQKLYWINEWHLFDTNTARFKGMITGISDLGELLVKDERGDIRNFMFKEIKFIT